jgi:hypothetical protein
MVRGRKSASARPGPCTRPRSADAPARRGYHPARQTAGVRSYLLAAVAASSGRPEGRLAACGRSSLTPGRAGWSRVGPTGPAQSPSCSEAAASSQGARGAPAQQGRAYWRPYPMAPPPWSSEVAAGPSRRWWPAGRRPQQDACPWTCQRIARAYATGPLAPPHSSLCDPAFELWQHAAWWCCTGSRELAAPPDTEEVTGSNPVAPTNKPLTSGNAGQFAVWGRFGGSCTG